jgi:hypothetical protein
MDLYKRIFIFSKEQMQRRKEIEGKNVRFGTVTVNGVNKVYTDIVLKMDDVKFSDAQKLVEGDIRKLKYTEPSRS